MGGERRKSVVRAVLACVGVFVSKRPWVARLLLLLRFWQELSQNTPQTRAVAGAALGRFGVRVLVEGLKTSC